MKIPIDPPPWDGKAEVLATWTDGAMRCFALAGRSDIVAAEVLSGEMVVYPDRSAQHRALVSVLGLDPA